MTGLGHLAYLWALFFAHTGHANGVLRFLERHQGDSVVFSCVLEPRDPSPFGVYLLHGCQHPVQVLFMLTKNEFSAQKNEDKDRISVSGDPSSHVLNVTISHLMVSDTGCYFCEFVVENPSSEDLKLPGKNHFFLNVRDDDLVSVDVGLVETCDGGSAVLPCRPPNGEDLAVEGVSLMRQRGHAPVEVLYNSRRHHGSASPSSSSSQFSAEKVRLSSAPGPGGITYNLTLQQLQPDDSGLYSCQLLLRGRADSSTSLGRHLFFVSVQGERCPSYSVLLYTLSSAVAVLFVLLLGLVVIKRKPRTSKPHSQAPIYEDMAGVKATSQRLVPQHLEEKMVSDYSNCPVKKSTPENHYETPSGALWPRKECQK